MNPAQIGSAPGPGDVLRRELPNGIVVLARHNPNSLSVSINGYLQTGALFNPPEKLGLGDFTASALMRGTHKHDRRSLYDALESIGAGMSFSGGTHTTGFFGRSLAEDMPTLLSLLAETLRSPAFPLEQIEKLRAQILTALALRAQDTEDRAALAFDELVYAGHPYSLPEEGHPETVARITRDDLVDFHDRTYGPRGMVLVVVGGIPPETAAEQVLHALGDWHNPEQTELPALPQLSPLEKRATRRIALQGMSQSDIFIGAAGPPRTHPEFMAAAVGNEILGQFGMMGRIGERVREQAGLAYYASSSVSGGLGPGPWVVSAGVDPQNEKKANTLILGELQRFVQEPVSADELADVQSNFIGRLPLSLESNDGVSGSLLQIEKHSLGLDHYQRYPEMVKAVTPEAILEIAQQHLDPDKVAIATAGPPKRKA